MPRFLRIASKCTFRRPRVLYFIPLFSFEVGTTGRVGVGGGRKGEWRGLRRRGGRQARSGPGGMWDYEAAVERRQAQGGTSRAAVAAQIAELRAWLGAQA